MKKIYLCYAVRKKNEVKERIVTAVFSEKSKAMSYCSFWNNAAIESGEDITYFETETKLDFWADLY